MKLNSNETESKIDVINKQVAILKHLVNSILPGIGW